MSMELRTPEVWPANAKASINGMQGQSETTTNDITNLRPSEETSQPQLSTAQIDVIQPHAVSQPPAS